MMERQCLHGASVVGVVTATSFEGSFTGDGSGLTGVVATGSGIPVLDSGSPSGNATTLNLGDNLVVEYVDAGGVATLKADLSIISNLGFVTQAEVDASIAAVVSTAPETLDTLQELSSALGDDPNFSTTIVHLLEKSKS